MIPSAVDGYLEPVSAAQADDFPQRVIRAGVVVAFALVALQTASQALSHLAFDGGVGQLNVDAEPNAWSWASSSASACTAFVLFLLLLARPERARIPAGGLLVVVVALFSADDALQIHERLRYDVLGLEEGLRVVWPTVYLPWLALVFYLLWNLAAETPEGRRSCRTGLLMLVAAVACELLSAALVEVGHGRGTGLYDLEVAVEEGLELGGWVLVLTGLTGALLARNAAADRPARARDSGT